MINRDEVMDMLRIDTYQRKTRVWPLIPMSSTKKPSNYPHKSTFLASDMSGSRNFVYDHWFDMTNFRENLRKKYPLMETILEKYKGKLIVAGGALVRAMMCSQRKSDLDFFFINCSKEEITTILKELRDTVFKEKDKKFPIGCLRNLKTTTFIVETRPKHSRIKDPLDSESETFGTQYQFVHSRSYPNPESVIGGFDLTIAACYYDGEEVYSTTLGAWSLQYMANIVDPARRSTTYEQRLRKYANFGVLIIFPFCSEKEVIDMALRNNPHSNKRTRFEILRGLELWVSRSGIEGATSDETKREFMMGDYGPVALGYASVNYFNAVLAWRGKWEALTWTSKHSHDVFDDAEIGIQYPYYFTPNVYLDLIDLLVWFDEKKSRELHDYQSNKRNAFSEIWAKEIKKIKKEIKKSVRKLEDYVEEHGVHYLGPNENPGRQGDVWTSSFNPIQEDIRQYYPPGAKIEQLFISHETAFLLKCMMGLNYQRDVFRNILNILARELYFDAVKKRTPEEDVKLENKATERSQKKPNSRRKK